MQRNRNKTIMFRLFVMGVLLFAVSGCSSTRQERIHDQGLSSGQEEHTEIGNENTQAASEQQGDKKENEAGQGEWITPTSEIVPLADGLSAVRYEGNDGFQEFLDQGGAASDQEVMRYLTEHLLSSVPGLSFFGDVFGCSTLSVRTPEGGAFIWQEF